MLSRLAQQGYKLVLAQYHKTTTSNGFLLPVVIALGLGIGTISVVAMNTVAQNSATLNTQYYTQVAREAAQAGVAAASTCIKTTNPVASTWTSSNTLTPDKDCTLTVPASNPPSAYIDDNAQFSSTYSVIKPTYQDPNNTSMLITSTGRAYTKIVGGARVLAAEITVHGYGTFPSNNVIVPTNYKKVSELSTGPSTTCTVAEDNWAYCWGSNANGMLGIGKNLANNRSTSPIAVAQAAVPAMPEVPNPCGGFLQPACSVQASPGAPANPMIGKKVTKISVGTTHVCAVATDSNGSNGRAYCWGNNDNGQLGDRSTTDSTVPVAVDTLAADYTPPPVTPNPCGGWFQPSCTPVVQPTQLKSALAGKTVVDITAGENFTCATDSDGKIYCWGNNDNGQLGTANRTSYNYPAAVDMTFPGTPYIPAVPATPGVCDWYQWWGACGNYSVQPTPAVPAVPAVPASGLLNKTVTKLAQLKSGSTMCVVASGDPVCWGQNYGGQVGNGESGTPRSASSACSGGASYPDVPIDTDADALRPSLVVGSTKFTGFTIYENYTTAISTTGRAYWWGGTTDTTQTRTICGSSGSGTGPGVNKYIDKTTRTYDAQSSPAGPLYNSGTTTINSASLALASGNPYNDLFCAGLSTNNQLYCDAHGTGINQGQTGDGYNPCTGWGCPAPPSGVRTVTMTPFGGISVQYIDTGTSGYTCAVTTDGQVFCWGQNANGQLGVLPASNRNVPAPVDINQATSALYSSGAGTGSGTTNGAFTIRAVY